MIRKRPTGPVIEFALKHKPTQLEGNILRDLSLVTTEVHQVVALCDTQLPRNKNCKLNEPAKKMMRARKLAVSLELRCAKVSGAKTLKDVNVHQIVHDLEEMRALMVAAIGGMHPGAVSVVKAVLDPKFHELLELRLDTR